MEIKLVAVGNSKGVRFNKNLLEQVGFTDTATLEIVDNGFLIIPIKRKPREGWEEQIKAIQASLGKEKEIIDYVSNKFDDTEWNWE